MTKSLEYCIHLIVFLAVFNFTTAIMSGGYVAWELGGSTEISSYGVTFFGLGNACMFPLGMHLKTRFNPFHVLLYCVALFCLAMFCCGAAPTFPIFNIARFVAGVASGIFIPLGLELLFFYEPENTQRTFIFFAFIATVMPVVGACFGGWLAYDLEWRWIFYSQIPIAAVLGYILYRQKIHYPLQNKKPFDFVGYIFYILSITSIVTAVTLTEQLDWYRSPLICFLTGLGVVSFIFFCLWEWQHETPFLDLKLFKIPLFSFSILCLTLLFSAYFGTIILLSLWLYIDVRYTPLWISLLIAHMAVSGGILFFALEKWFEKVASLWIVLIAICLFAISCFYSAKFNAEIDFGRLAIARTITGFGLAFFLFPLLFACLKGIPKPLHGQALAIFQSCRLLSASLGCAVYTTIWFIRRIFYHERLGEQLTIYSELTKQYLADVAFYGAKGLEGEALLEKALNTQADALALADCFYLMGWLMVGAFFLTLGYLIFEKWHKKKSSTDGSAPQPGPS